jgi:Rap1a immunity proteins
MLLKAAVLSLLVFSIPCSVNAYFIEGNRLVEWGREVERADRRDTNADFNAIFTFFGYIQGVADATEKSYCKKTTLSVQQISKIVLKYLDGHPEEWGQPAVVTVSKALKEAFPCP